MIERRELIATLYMLACMVNCTIWIAAFIVSQRLLAAMGAVAWLVFAVAVWVIDVRPCVKARS